MSESGRPCSICAHDERAALDLALLSGESLRDIAGRFSGVSRSALSRHSRSCIAAAVAAAAGFDDVVTAGRLVQNLNDLRAITLSILDEARSSDEHGVALKAIARLEAQAELIAKLAGELVERRQVEEVSVLVDARWIETRAVLLRVLQAHPLALADVVAGLAASGALLA